ELLARVEGVLPKGIDLEFDGKYDAMFCYKAKNYALLEDGEVTTRGSALRSRGVEPYLRELTEALLNHLLGVGGPSPEELLAEFREGLRKGTFNVRRLAKTEFLSLSPESYKHAVEIESATKPRRAALEVALKMSPMPRQGESVTYYIAPGQKKTTPDWQKARPIDTFDPAVAPYDADYYLEKLDDWVERYAAFLAPVASGQPVQGELL
ncbi:MAG TPA: DNA polymerase, partial [Opitutales bacterium]|nr:DNA polymerase [Opitutales bacterium]